MQAEYSHILDGEPGIAFAEQPMRRVDVAICMECTIAHSIGAEWMLLESGTEIQVRDF